MFSIFRSSKADRVTTLTLVGGTPTAPGQGASVPRSEQRRTLPSEQDRALSAEARQWLRSLPTRERPLALCSMYPRLANRLAAVWPDAAQTEAVFDELMIDRRGGRLGFAPLVASELMRLHRLHEVRLPSSDGN
ncbi:MAG: hypothetical protein K2X42_06995 [Burkholderiaceae bacterium]|nr:hypothetical protein [Burkholderiaceae bacterium]